MKRKNLRSEFVQSLLATGIVAFVNTASAESYLIPAYSVSPNNVLLLQEAQLNVQNAKSKWSATALSGEQCDQVIAEIENGNGDVNLAPEILSAVEVVYAECRSGADPEVVVKDSIPFAMENVNLIFAWSENNKLSVKVKEVDKANDYVSVYSTLAISPEGGPLSKSGKSASQKKPSDGLQYLEARNFVTRWWDSSKVSIAQLIKSGTAEIYIPIYAYHGRSTYSTSKLQDLREFTPGFGMGTTFRNRSGNSELVFIMAHLDSHSDLEINVGYGWLKNFQVTEDVLIGLGYSAGVISRSDYDFPVPFILPMGNLTILKKYSIGFNKIPKIPGNSNSGDVTFIHFRILVEK